MCTETLINTWIRQWSSESCFFHCYSFSLFYFVYQNVFTVFITNFVEWICFMIIKLWSLPREALVLFCYSVTLVDKTGLPTVTISQLLTPTSPTVTSDTSLESLARADVVILVWSNQISWNGETFSVHGWSASLQDYNTWNFKIDWKIWPGLLLQLAHWLCWWIMASRTSHSHAGTLRRLV